MTSAAARLKTLAPEDGASGGALTVIFAFCSNLIVALGKSVAAFLTGSASMTAEAAHSWADTGNQIFLLIAEKRGSRKRDAARPLGYGRETYVWSMFAALGLFTVGAVVSIMHGIQELQNPEPVTDANIAYIVLAVAFIFEGASFAQAFYQARKRAKKFDTGTLDYVVDTSNTTLRAVFFEDSAALVGLLIAAGGIFLHEITGSALPDAIGSILIGVLLGVVAVVLIDRNRRFLIGQPLGREGEDLLISLILEQHNVARVTYIHLEWVGPARMYLVAAVDMEGENRESTVAEELRAVEAELEKLTVIEEAVLTLALPADPSLTGRSAEAPSTTAGNAKHT